MERSADPAKMAEAVKGLPTAVSDDARRALRSLVDRAAPGDAILVTGSLYLLGEVRPVLVAPRT
jgi:folylpolyglutamate synthase/dihydropteroate synthase